MISKNYSNIIYAQTDIYLNFRNIMIEIIFIIIVTSM